MPVLIAGYVVHAFFPLQTISTPTAGLAIWGAVTVLSASIVPAAALLEEHGGHSVRAEPGAELDRFNAGQGNRVRAYGPAELSKMDEETKLFEVKRWMRASGGARIRTRSSQPAGGNDAREFGIGASGVHRRYRYSAHAEIVRRSPVLAA